MRTRQWYLRCWYNGDTDTTVVFWDVNLQTLLSSKSPLQRCRERKSFSWQAIIKYCWYEARQQDLQFLMRWRHYSLALSHWYISGNTCIIIMQFIHIVQVEILFLTVHDIQQDHCIFIPGVLYILLFCSRPPISYHIIIRTLSYKPTRECDNWILYSSVPKPTDWHFIYIV